MINVTKQRYWPRHLSLMDILDNTKIIKGQALYRIMKLSVGCNATTNKNMDFMFSLKRLDGRQIIPQIYLKNFQHDV